MAKLNEILNGGTTGNNQGNGGGGTSTGGTSSSGGASSNSGSQTGGGTQQNGGGDRGVVEHSNGGTSSTQTKQPTADPSENAKRMVEQLRQQQAAAPPAPKPVKPQDFIDYQAEKQGLNNSMASRHYRPAAPSVAAKSGTQQAVAAAPPAPKPVKPQDFLDYQAEKQGLNNSMASRHYRPAPPSVAAKSGAQQADAAAPTAPVVEQAEEEVKPHLSLKELLEKLNPYQQPTEEEIQQERKRQRRSAVFSAIGDGIAALSNLYFTTRHAPNAYDPSQSLSGKAYERYERLRKEREANNLSYINAYINAAKADDLQAIRQQNADANEAYRKSQAEKNAAIAKAQEEVATARAKKDAAATALAEKKLEYLIQGWPVDYATKKAKLDLAKAEGKKAQVEADNAQQDADDRHEVAKATVRQKEASATNSYAQASNANSGGSSGGGGGGKNYGTFLGQSYQTKADYDKAVVDYARRNGIPLTYMRKSGVAGQGETQTERTIAGLAAAGEEHYRTHGGGGGGKPQPKPKPKAKPQAKASAKAPAKSGRSYTHTKSLGL